MCADSASYKKTSSPQSSTEVSSLQVNRSRNKEALERHLQCRRSIKELVNQGILLNPSISNPDKVRQLQRAKLSDLLKHKIEKRPDRQSLINLRIIRDDKPGTSPYILEQCHNLEKNSLRNSLKSKLIARPGSLELVEKGVLQVAPGVDTLVRTGSILYPRVEPVAHTDDSNLLNPLLMACGKFTEPSAVPFLVGTRSQPAPSKPAVKQHPASTGARPGSNTTAPTTRSIKDETVVYKLGSLVFHNYCPKSSQLATPNLATTSSFQQRQKAREAQQAEMLRLQATTDIGTCFGGQQSNSSGTPKHADQQQQQQQHTLLGSVSYSNPTSTVSYVATDVPMPSVCSPSSYMLTPSETSQGPSASSDVSDASPSSIACLLSPYTPSPSSVDSSASLRSLEQLSCVRLRAECQERNLPRSGPKSALVRQLEPFRDEILAKYSRTLRSRRPRDNQSTLVDCRVTAVQNDGLTYPAWSTALRSTSAAIPVRIQPLTTDASGNVHHQSAILNLTPGLRHSTSAPYIVDSSALVPVHNHNTTGLVPQQHCFSSSGLTAASQLSIPVAVSSTVLFMNPYPIQPSTGSADSYPVAVTASSSDPSIPPTTVYVAPNLFSVNHHNPDVCSSPSLGANPLVSASLVNSARLSHQDFSNLAPDTQSAASLSFSPQTLFSSASGTDCLASSMTAAPSELSQPTADSIASISEASGLPPSLAQIEDVWLQVRSIRRRMAKDQPAELSASGSRSDLWDHAQRLRLRQEHDRLVVLCRLLVIDRLDALDDLLDSALDSSSSDSAIQAGSSATSRIERNLLLSYLRQLGGSNLVSRIPAPFDRCRRSSSPVLHTQPPRMISCSSSGVDSSCYSPFEPSPMAPVASASSAFPDHSSMVNTPGTFSTRRPAWSLGSSGATSHLAASSWSDGLQQASGGHHFSSDQGEFTDAEMLLSSPPRFGDAYETSASPPNAEAVLELLSNWPGDSPAATGANDSDQHACEQPIDCSVPDLDCGELTHEPSLSNVSEDTAHSGPSVFPGLSNRRHSQQTSSRTSALLHSSLTYSSDPHRLSTQSSVPSSRPSHAAQHDVAAYFPQPFAYSFLRSSSNNNNNNNNSHVSRPPDKPGVSDLHNPPPQRSSHIPAQQMAADLFGSLDTVDFGELMDVCDESQAECRLTPTGWSSSTLG